ncbi:MAG: hypothetical protein P4M00_21205 [Azospirillaceae bacterium]|nr:hypothetical protein [Azospirillaceae bacterium]
MFHPLATGAARAAQRKGTNENHSVALKSEITPYFSVVTSRKDHFRCGDLQDRQTFWCIDTMLYQKQGEIIPSQAKY